MKNFIYLNPLFLFKKNPQSLIFFVTARCNCFCKMCFYLKQISAQNPENELSIDEIIRFSRNYGKLKFLALSGGEPLLREDLIDIIDIFAANNKPQIIDLPTNGSLADELIKFIDYLCPKYKNILFNIQLSIDALDERHNSIRNHPNLFEKIKITNAALKKLAASHNNLKIQIVTVLSKFNADNIFEFYSYLEKYFFCDRYIISDIHGAVAKDKINSKDYEQIYKFVYQLNKNKCSDFISKFYNDCNLLTFERFKKIKASSNLGKYCRAGQNNIVLRENGDICACEPLWNVLGNIREYGYNISEILNSDKTREFYNNIREKCHCNWSCAQTNALIYNPNNWCLIFYNFIKNLIG